MRRIGVQRDLRKREPLAILMEDARIYSSRIYSIVALPEPASEVNCAAIQERQTESHP